MGERYFLMRSILWILAFSQSCCVQLRKRRVCRLGSYKPLEVDVKIVAAMNEDPQECVRKGKLREDLLYRLSVVRVDMPTLQERRCDIELLMKYFISKFNSSMKKDIFGVDEESKKNV